MANKQIILDAISAAKRFTSCANFVLIENAASEARCGHEALQGTKSSGAMKRASMDLTRALAALRKPNS